MTGFDVYNSQGKFIGHSEADDPVKAAEPYLLRGRSGEWVLDMFENADGTITANWDGATVTLKAN